MNSRQRYSVCRDAYNGVAGEPNASYNTDLLESSLEYMRGQSVDNLSGSYGEKLLQLAVMPFNESCDWMRAAFKNGYITLSRAVRSNEEFAHDHFKCSHCPTAHFNIRRIVEAMTGKEDFPTFEDLKTRSLRLSTRICLDWEILNSIILRSEALVRKRWLKKSTAQRKAILLDAWPNMPHSHRPDIQQILRIANAPALLLTHSRDKDMWPYINLDDLLEPNALLLFLNARGRNIPATFAASDLELAPLWKRPHDQVVSEQGTCTMKLTG